MTVQLTGLLAQYIVSQHAATTKQNEVHYERNYQNKENASKGSLLSTLYSRFSFILIHRIWVTVLLLLLTGI